MLLRFLILFSMVPILQAAPDIIYTKQVAASAEEINSKHFTMPYPKLHGIRSQHALLPIDFSEENGEFIWNNNFFLEAQAKDSFMLLTPPNNGWIIQAKSSQSERFLSLTTDKLQLAKLGFAHKTGKIGIGNQTFSGDIYNNNSIISGKVNLKITASNRPKQKTAGFVLINTPRSYQIYSYLQHYNLLVGQEIGINSFIFKDTKKTKDQDLPTPDKANLFKKQVSLKVIYPNQTQETYPMFDDGQHNDEKANDGIYGANFIPTIPGHYLAQVTITLTSFNQNIIRTTEHYFPVLASEALVSLSKPTELTASNTHMDFGLSFSQLKHQGNLRISAELWGYDKEGKAIAINWLSRLVSGNESSISFNNDLRWIAKAKAQGPFSLKNIIVQDAYTHIPITQIQELPLKLSGKLKERIKNNAKTMPNLAIDKTMLMGSHPIQSKKQSTATIQTTTSGKLMLVHGYCSDGNPWSTTSFSDYVVFIDANQSRSHDEFAQLINSFGSNLSSYGIVAHSQGGAASLHLYTYYWSGLDNAQGERLIQSVGTPYQGTALAGTIAWLGDIFGVGCGDNWDLTYDGAALWLANIPSWARNAVYYHTTSFEDKAWSYDYCDFASDLLLDDPEDGVVEKSKAQLSYGNNMGHKEGWCHTGGMRDPSQTTDNTRNAEMNGRAAR